MDEATILMDLSPALRGEVCFFLVDGGLLKQVRDSLKVEGSPGSYREVHTVGP
jgi:hypothetical protein